jgi:glycosyltransferase involved in cell wall biosynthesis
MQVDVVIPAFNAASYVGEALASVMAQGNVVARVIVVDDASTDGTAAVVRQFGAPVELVVQPSNGGAAAARNAGIALCTAPFVAFLDADDRWLPGKLAAQCDALLRAPTAAFAICGVRQFASPELPPAEQAELSGSNAAEAEGWLPSALLVRRGALDTIGMFDRTVGSGEAIDWFNRAKPHGHVAVATVCCERRLHRANTTRCNPQNASDYLRVARLQAARRRAGGTA